MRKSFLLALVLLPLLSFTLHKFYVSVTNINYSEKNASFQITSRIFIDDLEAVLEERYDINPELATQNEAKVADEYIEKYFRAKFAVALNGEIRAYSFLGKKYDNDVVICYLELTDVDFSTLKSISVQNEILTDMFEEQKNIVHFKWKDQKKSFVLIRENNKGMLNF
ncbi:hypothetical protein LV716_02665 [Flagellimonas sp. HMM57]|uniref:DUF6702 family protein n=1 Tax=unclassified Flagellimonas TaxID=2644544 RepID=UPI0013D123A4|nr:MULTISPECIES: DUF6702 family protein [unclassified Flagellimonas]UII76708.1 hypothetical protein LV716_02665 [Flagellimonas sp. HMM57]